MLIFSLKASLEAPISTISLDWERDAGTGRECSGAFCSAAQYAVCVCVRKFVYLSISISR